ncbi:hypothetical protein EJB05_18489 [Eragrostis curvula]|uniref:Uncharacterized protein n=1 Tax=Eragrostis curvula TaxID=38414 RepID=A0A5J9VLT8_9POAL|nr:hypothetical protein EJB05_18489 [Eragrostis curvula]
MDPGKMDGSGAPPSLPQVAASQSSPVLADRPDAQAPGSPAAAAHEAEALASCAKEASVPRPEAHAAGDGSAGDGAGAHATSGQATSAAGSQLPRIGKRKKEEQMSDSEDSDDESEEFWSVVLGGAQIAQIYVQLYLDKNPPRIANTSGMGWLLHIEHSG